MEKIKPFFESTLAKPVRAPGSDIEHRAGARVVIQSELQSKRFGALLFTTPNAADALLHEGGELVEKCEWILTRINGEKPKFTVWSDLNSIPGMTAERALREDPNAKTIRHANDNLFYRLIAKASELLFILIAAIEAMVNAKIPASYIHTFTTKKGEQKNLNKTEFEMQIRLEDKLIVLASIKGLESPKTQKWWSSFKKILTLRNDIVHLKTKGEAFKSYNAVYTELIDLEYREALEITKAVISYYS